MAEPVIGAVLEKAQKYLTDNWELPKAAQEMIKELTDKLKDCQENVKKVEKIVIIKNRALADWLRMLKDTVYDAEDVLDNMEATSVEVKVQEKNKVRKFASSGENLESLKMVVDQLNKFSTDLPKILEVVNMIENNEFHTREVTNPRETISLFFGKMGLYGRQKELKQILDLILSSELKSIKGLLVIPIVGMGGVGKTALAQVVYNNSEVQQTFAKRAWISVSNNHGLLLVMSKIYQSLSEHPVRYLSQVPLEVDISKELSATIRGVKLLIVLDNMFESQWDDLYTILSFASPGSVVLITTQNQLFANRVRTFDLIALSTLTSDIFLDLFEHFAFGNKEIPKEKRIVLKSIGKKIANKLRGLPLAAKIIGNILRSNVDTDKWRDILNREWWDIPEAKSRILPTIAIGYEQLDPCLRQCFSYCSLFPRKSLIEKDRLVHMWIAQNFIQCDVNGVMRLEEIGRQWFDELVKKSFFQRAGDNDSYVMHELMHDLAVIVSSGECFYLGEGLVEIPLGVRHLAIDTNNLEVIKGIQKHKNLRSLLYFGCGQVEGVYSAIDDTLSNLESIRVLDLSYLCMEYNSKPPSAIWNLQHLRFLDLSSKGIKVLTNDSSINLYHLQALYIRKCYFKELPKGINKLINLRHLCAEEETIAKISGIGQLTNLQELGVFIVRKKRGHTITELENLREIGGTLTIKNFENIKKKDEAIQAKLVHKKHLDSIHIIANHTKRKSNEDMEVLQELQPNQDIKELRIDSYAGLDFPNWIIQIGDRFRNLNTLRLVSCVNVKVLPPLGELASLKHLEIVKFVSVKLIDSNFYGKNQTVFPLLEVLVLDTLSNCEEWTDAGAREFFPRLSQLTIESNYTLTKAPLNLFRSTLKELKIGQCERLISLGNIISNLSSITHLELYCYSESITLDPLNMPLLEVLDLWECPELKIKGDLQSLTRLKFLKLVDCPELFSQYSTRDQQKGKGLHVHQDAGLRSLTHIEADYSLLNHEYHLILGSLPSLRILKFSGITHCTNNQNLWFEEMTALKEITLSFCKFEHLPASLTQLPTLKKMALERCTRLKSLTDSMPPNLQELHLTSCSRNLVQLCKAYEGQDQQLISIIPVIHIDDYTDRKDAVPKDATKMESMEIRKPQISDAIGQQQACGSCGKIFEFRDLVLRNWEESETSLVLRNWEESATSISGNLY